LLYFSWLKRWNAIHGGQLFLYPSWEVVLEAEWKRGLVDARREKSFFPNRSFDFEVDTFALLKRPLRGRRYLLP